MPKIAFITFGNMGGPMAANLAKASHEVTAFDLSAAAGKKAVAAGCKLRWALRTRFATQRSL
ncbi:MAG: NAD(P)-binding domain-containing protein [Parvularculaceae bacterium]